MCFHSYTLVAINVSLTLIVLHSVLLVTCTEPLKGCGGVV